MIIKKIDYNFVYDDIVCSEILNNFLEDNNYNYTFTDDARRNEKFLKLINRIELNDLLVNWRVLIRSLMTTVFKKIFTKRI
ncbi:MAG: hypothetical protein HOK38_06420 [Flavobacteriaceae bacterium]|jgi:hypothetical protein|nr:hypothetical protein [Flavobacteriaceae bacterium]